MGEISCVTVYIKQLHKLNQEYQPSPFTFYLSHYHIYDAVDHCDNVTDDIRVYFLDMIIRQHNGFVTFIEYI